MVFLGWSKANNVYQGRVREREKEREKEKGFCLYRVVTENGTKGRS